MKHKITVTQLTWFPVRVKVGVVFCFVCLNKRHTSWLFVPLSENNRMPQYQHNNYHNDNNNNHNLPPTVSIVPTSSSPVNNYTMMNHSERSPPFKSNFHSNNINHHNGHPNHNNSIITAPNHPPQSPLPANTNTTTTNLNTNTNQTVTGGVEVDTADDILFEGRK